MTKSIYLFILFTFLGGLNLGAQKILQIETYGKAKAQKITIGQQIAYKLNNEKKWQTDIIRDFLVDENIIELDSRFINLQDIYALRFSRKAIKTIEPSLYLFGAAWSGFALIGYATDGNPDTQYSSFDLGVTLSSAILGWGLGRLFKYKTIKIGKRKKLRLVDISF